MLKTIIDELEFPTKNLSDEIDKKYSKQIQDLQADWLQELKRARSKLEHSEIRVLEKAIKKIKGNWVSASDIKLKLYKKYIVRRNYGTGTIDKPSICKWREYWDHLHGKEMQTLDKKTFPNATIEVFIEE